jgi:hypothetical protein
VTPEDQPTLFDSARLARDSALTQVEDASDEAWRDRALTAVLVTARLLPEFFSDDVWRVGGLDRTREDRALGPVMLRAARLGWCVKTDRVRPSVRSHLSGKPVWRSLIHRQEG